MALNSVRKSLTFDDETLVNVKLGILTLKNFNKVQSKIWRDPDLDNIQIKFGNTKPVQPKVCTFKNHPIILKTRQFSEFEKEYDTSEQLKLKKIKSNPSNGWLCSNLQDYLKCDKEEDQIKDFMARTLKQIQENDLKSRISTPREISVRFRSICKVHLQHRLQVEQRVKLQRVICSTFSQIVKNIRELKKKNCFN